MNPLPQSPSRAAAAGIAPRLPENLRRATRAVDTSLYRLADSVVSSLVPNHPARLGGWTMPLRDGHGTLIRYTPEEFERLEPLARHAEVVRAEAEALLIHEQLGFVLLNEARRQALAQRALGIPPANEADRFAEIAAFYEVSPKHILIDTANFTAGVKAIEANYGLATALGYGLLVILGARTTEEMVKYGELIQTLFDELTLNADVARTLTRTAHGGLRRLNPELQLTILTAIRERLWQTSPRSPGLEFRLTRILEAALKREETGFGTSPLGLAALDALMLAKMTARVRLVTVENGCYLEVKLNGKSLYWEPATLAPLSYVPMQVGRKSDIHELFPRNYYEIGVWNSRQGQMTRAIQALKTALELKPAMPEAYLELAQVYQRSNRPDEAIQACQQAVSLAPHLAEAYVPLGCALLSRNRVKEAIEALRMAIRIKPNLAEAFLNLGFAYERAEEPDKAALAYQTAIRIRPDYAHAHFNLGNLHLNAQKYDQAIEEYKTTVKLNPHYVRAFYNLGQAYYQRKMLDDALETYKRVLRINPKHAGALLNLGIIYRDKGMTEKAVEVMEQAVALNPNLLR